MPAAEVQCFRVCGFKLGIVNPPRRGQRSALPLAAGFTIPSLKTANAEALNFCAGIPVCLGYEELASERFFESVYSSVALAIFLIADCSTNLVIAVLAGRPGADGLSSSCYGPRKPSRRWALTRP